MAKQTKESDKQTPLMKQYAVMKGQYPDAILLFRVGDFYEMFGQDAVQASKVLDIVLTRRANGAASFVELAGFPYHALDNYLPRLVRAGLRVAICEQLEDPKLAQGIVKRGVTELITPGLTIHDNVLDTRQNNFLAALFFEPSRESTSPKRGGVAFLDLSTGEFCVSEGSIEQLLKLIQGFKPSELIFAKGQKSNIEANLSSEYHIFGLEDWFFTRQFGYEKLTTHFQTPNLKGFGAETLHEGLAAAGAILHYLESTEHKEISHITGLSLLQQDDYLWLDKFTIRNLELVSTQHDNGVPLIKILDQTATAMGARMLRQWLVLPLAKLERIQHRQAVVAYFLANEANLMNTISFLKGIGDLERLVGKVAVGRINPREMLRLCKSLENTKPLRELLTNEQNPETIQSLGKLLDPLPELQDYLQNLLKDEVPLAYNQGNIIREGFHAELDELRQLANDGKAVLDKILAREIQNTGITSLKISYNKVFGYYIEVTNAHKNRVPTSWIRKQTLTGAERYITEELKIYEEKILTAEDRSTQIETQLFQEALRFALKFVPQIQTNARWLALTDVLASFAILAQKNNYTQPLLSEDFNLNIWAGRHPVIEHQLPPNTPYIPNDVILDTDKQQIIIITGPNMAGKSALLRQTALIVLMAQIGCFVPAERAEIGLVDKIFTRVGATDNLAQGESTFMVEMSETAAIMNNLSSRSLVLMDEIGRGTSTYDGISIAWALVEFLHQHKHKAKTLFATHYHELSQLADNFERVKNFNVAVKEIQDKIIFLRKLKEGSCEHSFGINVAQIAGMPPLIIARAKELMTHFENSKIKDDRLSLLKSVPKNTPVQANLFAPIDLNYNRIKEVLRLVDINAISPVEALLKLNELKFLAEKSDQQPV